MNKNLRWKIITTLVVFALFTVLGVYPIAAQRFGLLPDLGGLHGAVAGRPGPDRAAQRAARRPGADRRRHGPRDAAAQDARHHRPGT